MSDSGEQNNENLIWCAKTGDLATLKTLLNKVPSRTSLIEALIIFSLRLESKED